MQNANKVTRYNITTDNQGIFNHLASPLQIKSSNRLLLCIMLLKKKKVGSLTEHGHRYALLLRAG